MNNEKHISCLDDCNKKVLLGGVTLKADHPGFTDKVYVARRTELANLTRTYKQGNPIPRVKYTKEESKTWSTVYNCLKSIHNTHASSNYKKYFNILESTGIYNEKNIPQLQDVSRILETYSGIQLSPVSGYLSPRDFLTGLAFKTFFCTQYIRHSKDPFYTPEPDCCHELLGHVPMLMDKNMANFSHVLGLASIDATDEIIEKIASCYFFTIEFGLCKEGNEIRAYGAGLLSCKSELEYALSTAERHIDFIPELVVSLKKNITAFQDFYTVVSSFDEVIEKFQKYLAGLAVEIKFTYDKKNKVLKMSDQRKRNSI